MINKSFLAFAFLHLLVPAVCIIFFDANLLWLAGGLFFVVATIRVLHETGSSAVVLSLCLLSGIAFTLTLILGSNYYMQGEGFNDAFFYHFNIDTLVIATRGYSSVFYPSLLGLLVAILAPAIIYRTKTQKVWPAVPVLVLWLLALLGNYPIFSLASYLTGHGVEQYPELAFEPVKEPIPQSTGSEDPVFPEQAVDKESETQANRAVAENRVAGPETDSQPHKKAVPEPDAPTDLTHIESQAEIQVETQAVTEAAPGKQLKKNIILIYAESLESLYFDNEIFGDIVPNIKKLSEHAHRFTNLAQVGGTGWTIAGIVASQCGFPLKVSNHLASNSSIASVKNPYEEQICLADILSASGYQTIYMGGAPLWFAGKGNFLRTHGYQQIFGQEELSPRLRDKSYQSGWGIYDESLTKMALEDLRTLENKAQPYLLTLLTLDTHHPTGIPSASCKKLANNNDEMSNAIYCSDQLIAEFINEVMTIVDMSDTIIVLFSDHLSLRNTLWDKLRENRQKRRLTLMIFDDTLATVSNQRGTHFDVAPTILEAAGFDDHTRIGAGQSLFLVATDEKKTQQSSIAKYDTPSLLGQGVSVRENGVILSRKDLSINIGDLTLKANSSGQKFVSGMYLVVLDEAGNVLDAIYSDDYESLAKNLDGKFVIGVSVMQAPPYSADYFYGNISPDGKGIIQREFNHDIKLSPDQIWSLDQSTQ